jgi:hypothetical protein
MFVYEALAVWQIMVPLFLLGIMIVSESWSDNWLYLVVATQFLFLFYFGTIASPYKWLLEHQVLFGPAVVGTVLYIFAVIGLALGLVYVLLRLARGSRNG